MNPAAVLKCAPTGSAPRCAVELSSNASKGVQLQDGAVELLAGPVRTHVYTVVQHLHCGRSDECIRELSSADQYPP